MAGQKFDRFREIKIVGAGAFGKTVLVEDQTQGSRRVVIKVPLTEETETALINDLINNAVLQTSLKEMSHANIAHYLGFDRYDGRFVMILEYILVRDEDGVAKICDFGISQIMRSTAATETAASESISRKGVAQCPAHPALHLNLAMVLNTQKKRTEATDTLEKALQLGLGRQGPYAEALLRNWKAGGG